jgi:hypothetical protein
MAPRYRMTCWVEGCERAPVALGYCRGHYAQVSRHGRVTGPLRPSRADRPPGGTALL